MTPTRRVSRVDLPLSGLTWAHLLHCDSVVLRCDSDCEGRILHDSVCAVSIRGGGDGCRTWLFRRRTARAMWGVCRAAHVGAANGVCSQPRGRSRRATPGSPFPGERGGDGRGDGVAPGDVCSRGGQGPARAGDSGYQRGQLSGAEGPQTPARQGRQRHRCGLVRASRAGGWMRTAGSASA